MRLHAQTARTFCTLLLACAPVCVCAKAAATQTGKRGATARDSKQQQARDRAAEARRRAEVREAVVALLETADDARSFEDMYYRVRVQADAADVLWPFDEQAARSILRRAWDVTTAPGVIPAFKYEDESDDDAIDTLLTARRIVVACAAKHDARLADVYMNGLSQGLEPGGGGRREEDDAAGDSQSARDVWRTPSPLNVQRLRTASALLAEGAYEAAAAVAAPAVSDGVNRHLVDFIIALRAHAPREGDALYTRLLERTRLDPQADANDVLLLSQPILSPDLQIFINADGSAHMRQVNYTDAAMSGAFSSAPAGVRRAFYAAAAAVLLRPPRRPEGGAASNVEASALYFATGRLLPSFEREAPQYAAALHARMSALSAEVGAARAQSLSANMDTLSLSPKNPVDVLAHRVEALKKLDDARTRDQMRFLTVTDAARSRLWERARSVAAEIEDASIRRDALRTIAVYQVLNVARAYDDEPDGFDRAADFARAADVPPQVRAVGLARAAELAARLGNRARADALFGEALLFADEAGKDDGTRLTALVLVARSVVRANSPRVWEILPSLAAAANETENYSETGPQFSLSYGYTDGAKLFYEADEPLNLEDAFAGAARLDFRRALAEVRTLEDGPTRAAVTIAAARAALAKGGKPVGDGKAR